MKSSFARVLVALLVVAVLAPMADARTLYQPGLGYSHIALAAAPRLLGPTDDYPGQWEYVYDVWGGNQSWTRFATITGFNADLISNIHTAIVGEDIDGSGDLNETGVWQRWDSHSNT